MAAENEVVGIRWIGCRESLMCHEGDFEDDAIMDRYPVQLLQAVSAIKGGITKNKFSKFVLYASLGMDQAGRCTLEKGIAVVQVRENETVCKGRSCVDEEEWTDMPN